jgi:hypothetical protein
MVPSLAIPLCLPGDLARAARIIMSTRVGSNMTAWIGEKETLLVIAINTRTGVTSGRHSEMALVFRVGQDEGLWYVVRSELQRLS